MGVDSQRLEPAEMAARRYSLTVNDVHIIIEIPVGAVGGYFKVFLFVLPPVSCIKLMPGLHVGINHYKI